MLNSLNRSSLYVFLIIGAGLLGMFIHFYFGGLKAVITVNGFYNDFLDMFFKYVTFLGEIYGMVLCVFFFLMIKEIKWAIIAIFSIILSSAIASILKHLVFSNALRPKHFISNVDFIHQVVGVEIHLFNSFPSGHTLTMVCICTILALYFGVSKHKKIAHFILFFITLCVALSRVYLFQHFFIDVSVSFFLGLIISFATYLGLLSFPYFKSINNETV